MTRMENMLKESIAEGFGLSIEQVTDSVLAKMGEDPSFVYHLDVCKNDPEMLAIILEEAEQALPIPQPGLSSIGVMAKAGVAFARWAAAGFGRVEPEEYRRRLSICSSCDHLSEPPDRLIYKMVPTPGRSICGLCGCDVRRKAWLITEKCPDVAWDGDGRWRAGQ
jgi:hypothetical protein